MTSKWNEPDDWQEREAEDEWRERHQVACSRFIPHQPTKGDSSFGPEIEKGEDDENDN